MFKSTLSSFQSCEAASVAPASPCPAGTAAPPSAAAAVLGASQPRQPGDLTPQPPPPSAPAFQPLDPLAPVAKTSRNLPHWEQEGVTYFVTYRLADAMPAAKRRQWQWELDHWLAHHPKPWDAATWRTYHRTFEGPIQQWLDAGHGSCALKDPALREIVVDSFHHFDGQRYRMRDYVIMPNHVHLLVTPSLGHSLCEVVKAWKRFTGHRILKRTGTAAPFWLEESFDHIVRSQRQLAFYRRYIRENPGKASLPAGQWTHSEETVVPVASRSPD